MDIQIDQDLVANVDRGELDEWQAMAVQTCRDAAFARNEVEEIKKKVASLALSQEKPSPPPKRPVINLVARGG